MPQMMPMFWSIMLIFMILLIISTISFFYSINIPSPQFSSKSLPPAPPSSLLLSEWSWKW